MYKVIIILSANDEIKSIFCYLHIFYYYIQHSLFNILYKLNQLVNTTYNEISHTK